MLLSDNLKGDYAEPAEHLAELYFTLTNEAKLLRSIINSWNFDDFADVLKSSNDLLQNLNKYVT